jgi:glycyl-tRNA synthetase beta chain
VLSAALLEQVTHLVEHPIAILGHFDAAYLDLPPEVLTTCLEHHQKFFPVAAQDAHAPRAEETLLAHFIGIRSGMSLHQETVREGYERVLAARLADARFFFDHDRRSLLAAKTEALKGVTFQEKLGTLFEKKERVKRLVGWLASSVPGAEWRSSAERAADLCKTDLVTDMVREFPELQGVMARIYAQSDHEDPRVAEAAEQHYWPLTVTGALPVGDVSAAVALADKADTLAGDFAVGLIPTGSADPYGLRRAAVGALRILESRGWPVSVEALVRQAVEAQPASVVAAAPDTAEKLLAFMRQRFAALLEERSFKFDEIDAVLTGGIGEVPDALARLAALGDLRARAEFEPLSVAFKRAMNIVRQAAKGGHADSADVRPDLFKEPGERSLFAALESASERVRHHLATRAYRDALESMVGLREPLDAFFGSVMVMAEEPALRTNRLALMGRLVRLFSRIADFTKLQNA